jgi:hypothetical protein
VADISSEDLRANKDESKRYFLIDLRRESRHQRMDMDSSFTRFDLVDVSHAMVSSI